MIVMLDYHHISAKYFSTVQGPVYVKVYLTTENGFSQNGMQMSPYFLDYMKDWRLYGSLFCRIGTLVVRLRLQKIYNLLDNLLVETLFLNCLLKETIMIQLILIYNILITLKIREITFFTHVLALIYFK